MENRIAGIFSERAAYDYAFLRHATGWSIDDVIGSPKLRHLMRQLWLEKIRYEREYWAQQEKDYWEWVERYRGPLDAPQFKNVITSERAKEIAPWLECLMPLVMRTLSSL